MTFSVMAEIDASEFFGDEGPNWKWCVEHATFAHKDACEFVLHFGTADYGERLAKRMLEGGCTRAFVDAFLAAGRAGAIRVLFYA